MATNRLIDVVATRRKHLLYGVDIHRAFLHLEQDELVLVDPPRTRKDAKAAAGLNASAKFSKSLLGWCETKVHMIYFTVLTGKSSPSCTWVICVRLDLAML